jgi:hypothetical protein
LCNGSTATTDSSCVQVRNIHVCTYIHIRGREATADSPRVPLQAYPVFARMHSRAIIKMHAHLYMPLLCFHTNTYTHLPNDALCQCTSFCPTGTYKDGTCTGQTSTDVVRCLPCKMCKAGEYVSGSCTGGVTGDITCVTCKTKCSAGQYITQTCDGRGAQDTQCASCTSSCSSGFYLSGACDGSSFTNVVRCQACTQTCAPGQFITPTSVCSGVTTRDTVTCSTCKTSCPAGAYLMGSCQANGTRDFTCQPCTV